MTESHAHLFELRYFRAGYCTESGPVSSPRALSGSRQTYAAVCHRRPAGWFGPSYGSGRGSRQPLVDEPERHPAPLFLVTILNVPFIVPSKLPDASLLGISVRKQVVLTPATVNPVLLILKPAGLT